MCVCILNLDGFCLMVPQKVGPKVTLSNHVRDECLVNSFNGLGTVVCTCDILRDTNLCLTVHMLVGLDCYSSDLRLWFQCFLALAGSHTLKNLTKGSRLNNYPMSSEGPGFCNVIRASESHGERYCWCKHTRFRDEELGSPGPKSSVGCTALTAAVRPLWGNSHWPNMYFGP